MQDQVAQPRQMGIPAVFLNGPVGDAVRKVKDGNAIVYAPAVAPVGEVIGLLEENGSSAAVPATFIAEFAKKSRINLN